MAGVKQPVWLKPEDVPPLPKGWRAMPTEEACVQLKPGKLFDKRTAAEKGSVPVLSQGETDFIGYHDEEPGVMASHEKPVVTFANHTCAMRLMKRPFSTIQNIFPKVGKPGVTDTVYFYYASLGRVALSDYKGHHPIFRQAHIPVPPLPEQRRMAGILSAYDELMENSQRRIRILEAMVRALYREWFIHFRYPGSGRETGSEPSTRPAGHPSPGGRRGGDEGRAKLVTSPLGDIPQGWEVKKLKDACHLTMGQSPKSEFYNETGEGQPFHQGVTNFGERFPTDRLFCTVEGRIAEAGDILFSVRAPVGRMNIADKKIIIGRGLSAIRHKDGHQAFLWEQLRNRFTEDDMMGNGAIFAAVTKDDMQGIELVCPPSPIVVAATKHFEPVHTELDALTKQIANLRKTRDLLLPRLLSGSIELATEKN